MPGFFPQVYNYLSAFCFISSYGNYNRNFNAVHAYRPIKKKLLLS